jgi:hypothetical protein
MSCDDEATSDGTQSLALVRLEHPGGSRGPTADTEQAKPSQA